MRSTHRLIAPLLSCLCACGLAAAAQESPSATPPAWFIDHLEDMVGRRSADNSAYRSESEPFEAYVDEYWYAPGRSSISGRLFAVRDGEETDDFWIYRVYWHPGEGAGYIDQWARDGRLGRGRLTLLPDGTIESDQTYYLPDGTTSRSRHLVRDDGPGRRTTESFNWADGAWQPNRTYVWVRE